MLSWGAALWVQDKGSQARYRSFRVVRPSLPGYMYRNSGWLSPTLRLLARPFGSRRGSVVTDSSASSTGLPMPSDMTQGPEAAGALGGSLPATAELLDSATVISIPDCQPAGLPLAAQQLSEPDRSAVLEAGYRCLVRSTAKEGGHLDRLARSDLSRRALEESSAGSAFFTRQGGGGDGPTPESGCCMTKGLAYNCEKRRCRDFGVHQCSAAQLCFVLPTGAAQIECGDLGADTDIPRVAW